MSSAVTCGLAQTDISLDTFEKWVTREIPSEWVDKWLAAEARANLLQNFELSVIPGLLQTEDYARTVIRYNQQDVGGHQGGRVAVG